MANRLSQPCSFRVGAVLFDFDGTLTLPGALDFTEIKNSLGCPLHEPVLEFIDRMTDPRRQAEARDALDQLEQAAASRSAPNDGAEETIHAIRGMGIKIGIITRNSFASISAALKNFDGIGADDFDLIISRDDSIKPKPSPDGILMAARWLDVPPDEILMVGDFIFDVEAGRAAGSITVFLSDPGKQTAAADADFVISELSELSDIIRLGRPLPGGKFPNALLKKFLDDFGFDDPSVIINPGIGEDIAAVDVEAEEVLILKSDPITFATDAIGHYAVLINANDIATSGAAPRWLLTTLLLPVGISAAQVFAVLNDLKTVCRQWGITLCGGHTEITDAVSRTVISGTLAGTVARRDLIDKRRMRPGDRVLLTKGVSVEGTSIIARELGDQLQNKGMTAEEIERCKAFLDEISILTEARIAASVPGTSAMHDVTEGGLATALEELSIAGGHGIRVETEAIPIYPETLRIAELLSVNPLGLIGSGSLLIACRPESAEALAEAIRDVGITVTAIGEVTDEAPGIQAFREGASVLWPRFEVDEIARLF